MRPRLGPGAASRFSVDQLGNLHPQVRIARQPDIVVSLDGDILGELEAKEAGLDATAVDSEGRRVFLYREET